jgi:Rps23 Pro-64 3,4-dihydroxylase Tpa1-like proline 4-hydroxylase
MRAQRTERRVDMLDYEKLEEQAKRLHAQYVAASPYPHVVIDDFLDEAVADDVRREFAEVDDVWKFYHHYNEKKLAITDLERMPSHVAALLAEFESPRFVRFIEQLTGLTDLVPDPTLEGAGMHMIRRGGFLNIHNDFQTHTKSRTWSRQVNLILFLNRDWREEWGGHAEIWNADVTVREHALLPIFNRCLIFNTQAPAHHGHPDPLTCPEGEARKSIAVYYYRDEGRVGRLAPTDYHPRPDDAWTKRLLIRLDEIALRAVTFLKRHTPLSDETLSRILKRLSR